MKYLRHTVEISAGWYLTVGYANEEGQVQQQHKQTVALSNVLHQYLGATLEVAHGAVNAALIFLAHSAFKRCCKMSTCALHIVTERDTPH